MTNYYSIVLPLFGSPYIVGVPLKKMAKERAERIEKLVDGKFEEFDRKNFVIHPLFVKENKRWCAAAKLLNYQHTKVYVNEMGAFDYSPNMATVITNTAYRVGGCPHLFGEIVLEVPTDGFEKCKIDPKSLTLTDKCWVDGEFEPIEPEDDEEVKKLEAFAKENKYDYCEETGQMYVKVC